MATKRSKRYEAAAALVERGKAYPLNEAVGALKKLPGPKFDPTVTLSFRLGVDPRKSDQMVRGSVSLPHGTGKEVRVVVFAQGDAAKTAQEAGADEVGYEELIKKIQDGFLDFDVAIATPDAMGEVRKIARILGPRGLMPNPKTGTVTPDVAKAIEEFKGGMVEYRTDRFANVHVPIGKASFDEAALLLNLRALVTELERVRPASAKGHYMRKVVLSTTMGPGVRVDPNQIVTA
jgi:large subunit ribosomal protein L1